MKLKGKIYLKIVRRGGLCQFEKSYPDIYSVHEGATKIDTAVISALP